MNFSALRRWFWWIGWLIALLWFVRETYLPADLRALHLAEVSGNAPYLARLRWRYGRGARPLSLILDLAVGPLRGSTTVDGEEDEAVVPLAQPPHGPYRITLSATYRVMGVVYLRVRSVTGQF